MCVNCARVYVCFHKTRTRICIYISLFAHEVMNLRRSFFFCSRPVKLAHSFAHVSDSETLSLKIIFLTFTIQGTYLFTRRKKKRIPRRRFSKLQQMHESLFSARVTSASKGGMIERERERERERACARAGYFREQERYEGCMV